MSISPEEKEKYRWLIYRFSFPDGRKPFEFKLLHHRDTMIALPPEGSREMKWTLLDYCQCSICPLKPEVVRNCPIAFNISGLIEQFREFTSFERLDISVHTEERTFMKSDTLQEGLRSILGIYMASSGCPHMRILKPMVRFHLPFASIEETIYRHVTSYLLGQYFEYRSGRKPDINLQELAVEGVNIDIVNRSMTRRIRGVAEGDANRNALIMLNALGQLLKLEIEENLSLLKYLFEDVPD